MQRGVGGEDRKRKDYLWYATSHKFFLLIDDSYRLVEFGPNKSLRPVASITERVHEHGHNANFELNPAPARGKSR